MAHLPDGVLAAPVLIAGVGASALLVAAALRRLDERDLPQAAVLSAAFFVASLVSVPVGPGSVHLLLNGLMGLLLGWMAVPALLVALALQLVFFGHGGLTALGVNLFNLAIPALAVAALLRPALRRRGARGGFWIGAAAGLTGVLGTALLLAGSLALSTEDYAAAARVLVIAYLPLALAEALVSGSAVSFLARVDPESLPRPLPEAAPAGTAETESARV